jgi:hypothetical protein
MALVIKVEGWHYVWDDGKQHWYLANAKDMPLSGPPRELRPEDIGMRYKRLQNGADPSGYYPDPAGKTPPPSDYGRDLRVALSLLQDAMQQTMAILDAANVDKPAV